MSFVASSNGIDSIAAAEGIAVRDLAGNRFSVGANLVVERVRSSPVILDPFPAGGPSIRYIGDGFTTQLSGLYLIEMEGTAGVLPGAMVAGPQDRIYMQFVDASGDNDILASIPMKLYSRAAISDQVLSVDGAYAVQCVKGRTYRMAYSAFNMSETMVVSGFKFTMSMIPLTSSAVLFAPPAPEVEIGEILEV